MFIPIEQIKRYPLNGRSRFMNCWEFMKCGREKGGVNAVQLGVCPAYPNHGTHCAHVTGTLCGGQVQGTFAIKLVSCLKCDFFRGPDYDRTWTQVPKK